jgi:hypothetical protein
MLASIGAALTIVVFGHLTIVAVERLTHPDCPVSWLGQMPAKLDCVRL